MKFWITKYALTQNVYCIKGEVCGEYMLREIGRGVGQSFYHGRDWHKTKEAALADAEHRRAAKIRALEKQIAKLKALKFSANEGDA